MYHERQPEREPGGCRDSLVLTRIVFSVIFWPVVALMATMVGVSLVFYLFLLEPLLALIPIGLLVAAGFVFATWERRRFESRYGRKGEKR